MTYVGQFSRRFPDLVRESAPFVKYTFVSLCQPFGSVNKEHGELLRYVTDTRQHLAIVLEAPIDDIQAEYKVKNHSRSSIDLAHEFTRGVGLLQSTEGISRQATTVEGIRTKGIEIVAISR